MDRSDQNHVLRHVAAIINPGTRGSLVAALRALRTAVPAGVRLEEFVSSGHATTRAVAAEAAARCDLVIAVGGDGTVANVASGLLGTGVPLAIVPTGSTNVIAKELRLPGSPRAAAELAFRSSVRVRRDVGTFEDHCFLHMAGAGFDSQFFENTDRELKRKIGWVAYLPAALAALQIHPVEFRIVADGDLIEVVSSLVLVANGSAVVSPAFRLHPDIDSSDGWLDLLVFTATEPADVARTLGLLATSRLAESPYLLTRRVRKVAIEADPSLSVQLDGDVVGQTPATFEIVPAGIQIVVNDPALRLWPPFLAQNRFLADVLKPVTAEASGKR